MCSLGDGAKSVTEEAEMREIALSRHSFEMVSPESQLLRRRRRLALALTAFTASALVTGLFGLGFATASLIHAISSSGRTAIFGNVLLAATFPLVFLAAHYLDKIDEVNSAIRVANAPKLERDR